MGVFSYHTQLNTFSFAYFAKMSMYWHSKSSVINYTFYSCFNPMGKHGLCKSMNPIFVEIAN